MSVQCACVCAPVSYFNKTVTFSPRLLYHSIINVHKDRHGTGKNSGRTFLNRKMEEKCDRRIGSETSNNTKIRVNEQSQFYDLCGALCVCALFILVIHIKA